MRCLVLAAALALSAFGALAAAGGSGLKVVKRIAGPDGGWDYASFDPAHGRILIAHEDAVLSIDARTGVLNPHFAAGNHLHAVVPVPGANLLVTTNSGDPGARVLNATTGRLIAKVATAADADGAVWDPSTRDVMVANGDPGLITEVNPRTHKAVGVITVGGKVEFPAVDGKGTLFVNLVAASQVARIDLASRKVTARFPLGPCTHPTGLAYVTGARLVVACGGGGAAVLAAADGKPLAFFKTAPFPDAVIYDPVRKLAMIPSAFGGNLTVIALSGPKNDQVIDVVPTQLGARTGAVDPATGAVFLPTATYKLPIPKGQRPTPQPGTFVVLELER